jgi:peptidoglycan hydrolase CwlO-like protein
MATTEFLPVAVASGANVDPQGSFAGATYQLVGFTTGTARATQANKVWRQSSMMAAAWANVIVQVMGQNVLDDGNLPNLVSQLTATVQQIVNAAINASGLLARMATAEQNIIGLQVGLGNLTTTVNNNTAQINSLFARMSAAESGIVQLNNSVNSLLGRVGSLESSVASINGSVSWLTSQVNNLLGRMANAESAISSINNTLNDVYNRLNNLDNAINGINGQIGSINGQIGSINGHLGQLDSQVAQLMPQGSLGGNGWTSLPNGLIVQWAVGFNQTTSGTVYQTVNFPRAFPNACLNVQVTTMWTSGPDNQIMIYQTTGWNTGGVFLRRARRGDDGVNGTTPYIFAIGY